jgi:periplasmic nitrate reductase NapD
VYLDRSAHYHPPPLRETPLNISGIVVGCAPTGIDACAAALSALPGIEVHAQDRARGRLVITQETASTGEQEDGLRLIQALPGVLHAELVYHYFDEGGPDLAPPAQLVQLGGRK